MKYANKFCVVLAAAVATLAAGCSLFTGVNQTATAAAEAGLQLATVVVVQANCPTTSNPTLAGCYAARAAVLNGIVAAIEGAATSSSANLASVQAAADAAVANAPVQDQAALKILLNQAITVINQQIGASAGAGVLGATQQAVITTVGGWITGVTAAYGAAPAAVK